MGRWPIIVFVIFIALLVYAPHDMGAFFVAIWHGLQTFGHALNKTGVH